MCDGTSQMDISPKPCTDVAADGTGCDNEFEITDPDCVNGPFTFAVLTGADYLSLTETDETAGTFRISFEANNSTKPRSAVVRVTSSCTGLFKDFLFTQQGQGCDPSLGDAPSINSNPSGKDISFCAGGAVYLWVDPATPNLDQLIWTRNGMEIARGVNNLTVTQAGVYDIWMGIIGCNQLAGNAVTVTRDGAGAPDPVSIVVRGNNGLVCGPTGTTKLIAAKPATGTVRWFKDGVLQALTSPDNEIEAGVGNWFAVVNDGTCWSTPSDVVTVSVDPNTGVALIEPDIVKSAAFCAGGSVQLSVSNVQTGYTYTWYENNTQIGTGKTILYNVPSGLESVVIRCRATLGGSCAAESIGSETITTGTIPARPTITGDKQLCSGIATLNAVASGSGPFTYQWYKNDVAYANTQSITVNEGGEYAVTVTDGCTSPAAKITLSNTISAAPTVTLNRSTENPNQGDMVTYAATINFTPATQYVWTIENGTLISGGGNTANAVVKFDGTTGPASVKVAVSNACGTGTAEHNIANVESACVDPVSVLPSDATALTTVSGTGVTLGTVSATFVSGTPTAAYQWYSNTTASTTGGTVIDGATNNTYVVNKTVASSQDFYYYCQVKNAGCGSTTMSTGLYTVTVNPNPKDLTPGAGTFIGTTCFDVVESNFGDGCGTQASRTSQKADFSKPATNTQTYTFKTNGTDKVSNIRFIHVNTNGDIIEDITPGSTSWATATNLSGTFTVSVKYRDDLNKDKLANGAGGLDRDQALKAELYVVYNNQADGKGTDVMLKLDISVQDCTCCPGYLAVGGEYIQTTSGYLDQVTVGSSTSKFTNLLPFFTATGKSVCYYYRDGRANSGLDWPSIGQLGGIESALNICTQGTRAVDDIDRQNGMWRLPSIAELASIADIHNKLTIQNASAPETTNMHTHMYWSNNMYSEKRIWYYRFGQWAKHITFSQGGYFRCVKSQ
ncbi:DUF1566 domain-containing protein [Dysgonomonas sp. 521]|nr:DUF1566 domain-containing protein [Dysgonomonas sp. 521]